MVSVKTDIGNLRESARRNRVELAGSITATDVQKAVENLDTGKLASGATTAVFGSLTVSTSFALASGVAINWSSGDVTITHSSGTLAFAGADVGGYQFDASISGPNPTFSGTTTVAALQGMGAAAVSSLTVTNTAIFSSAVRVATTTSISGIAGAQQFQVAAFSSTDGIGVFEFSADANAGAVTIHKSRGTTAGTVTTVQNGDTVGQFAFAPADGTNYLRGARLRALVNGAVSTGNVPVDFAFDVSSANSYKETLRLTSDQKVIAVSAIAIQAGGAAGLGYSFFSTANFGVYAGSGAPTLAAAQGSLYLRSDGSTTNNRAYINSNGTTGWTAITTVA